MAKNIIGIDISDFSIEAVTLEKSKGHFKLESYARFRLSPEIVEDGLILNPKKLKEAILKMFKNAKPIAFDQSRKVFLSIPESKTFSKVLSLPKNIKDKDLKKAALNKAEEIIPESIDKLTVVTKNLLDTDKHKHIFYSAAETEVLKSFVSIFKELDIEVAGITTETVGSFAGLKKTKDKKNTLVLDLGARTTIASVFTEDCLCSSINIAIGGDDITKALVKKLNISYQQAEDKKRQIGFDSSGDGESMLISQGQLQPLVDELKIFIKYWQNLSSKNIEQIILIGGLAQMNGIDKYFGDNLNLPIQLGELFIDTKNLPVDLASSKYINAFGLAKLANEGTDIDFYKKISKEKKSKNKNKFLRKDIGIVEEKNKKISRFSKKNIILSLIIFILLASTGVMFIFKDKITSLIYKDNKQIQEEIKDGVVEVLEFKELISVVSAEDLDNSDYILGELYEVSIDKALVNTDLAYIDLITTLEEESNNEVLDLLNNEYSKEGYYIIPKVLDYEFISTEHLEENFILGETLTAKINYTFLSISKDKVFNWLILKYPNLSSDVNLNYDILNYSADNEAYSFKLNISNK